MVRQRLCDTAFAFDEKADGKFLFFVGGVTTARYCVLYICALFSLWLCPVQLHAVAAVAQVRCWFLCFIGCSPSQLWQRRHRCEYHSIVVDLTLVLMVVVSALVVVLIVVVAPKLVLMVVASSWALADRVIVRGLRGRS
jgi:hypothetical protein